MNPKTKSVKCLLFINFEDTVTNLLFQNTVSRSDLLPQAEKIIQELGSSQSILEIQYEGEVRCLCTCILYVGLSDCTGFVISIFKLSVFLDKDRGVSLKAIPGAVPEIC